MRSATQHPRGIFVPPEETEVYLANGWILIDDLNPHHVLMIPPDGGPPKGTREATDDASS